MKKSIFKNILVIIIISWGCGFILAYDNIFTDIIGIIIIIFAMLIGFIKSNPKTN